jgi:hypothetical protein
MKLFEVTVKDNKKSLKTIHVVCNNLSEIESLTYKNRTRLGFELTEQLEFIETKFIADTIDKLIIGEEKEIEIK